MKYGAALFILISCAAFPAGAAQLNTTSNLIDQGIEPRDDMSVAPKVLDGVPLMQELQERPKDPQLLDILPDISDPHRPFVAIGIIDVDEVYNFYKRALPAIGWQATGARDYKRGGETLHINAQANGKLTTVTFTESGAQ